MVIAIFTELLSLFVRLIMVSRYISSFNMIDYSQKVIFPCFTIAIISALLPVFLKFILDYSIFSSLINIFLSFVICSIAIFYWGCSRNERLLVISRISKMLHRL
jgi:hypothetical protein